MHQNIITKSTNLQNIKFKNFVQLNFVVQNALPNKNFTLHQPANNWNNVENIPMLDAKKWKEGNKLIFTASVCVCFRFRNKFRSHNSEVWWWDHSSIQLAYTKKIIRVVAALVTFLHLRFYGCDVNSNR